MTDGLVYLDNAATSFPKPREVLDRMAEVYAEMGASPGRGGYDLSVEAGSLVDGVRRQLADFFDAPDPDRVVFAANATDALNLAIQGMVSAGDHVVSTRLEHNSVLRPLHHLRMRGTIELDLVPCDRHGVVDPGDVVSAMRRETRLVVVTHASQVLGTVQPVAEIAALCAERGVPLVVDAAQTAGQVPVRLEEWNVAAVAFTGHKAMLGPTGSGGLVVAPGAVIAPTRFGGTGVDSASLTHTASYPHRLEAGTLNLLGIIGLAKGLEYLRGEGVEDVHRREMGLIRRLRDGLTALSGVTVYSPAPRDDDVPILTCGVEGMAPSDVGAILDADHGIAVRTGLHCAPLVHRDLGLAEQGSVRFSPGIFSTEADIDHALAAMAAIAASAAGRPPRRP
ncbi:MAG TPA: aminotransferase class V-fold PLP-dependent enzyme [Thermoleophilia bacterium]|nr:aminotransferase class V-fold PLP-dependent enzyme [Thermoleophilia bacterium]HQG54111.1 aminotransferase class V-fold PLP-dependent enzyme [Thermoleophilia bacterium]